MQLIAFLRPFVYFDLMWKKRLCFNILNKLKSIFAITTTKNDHFLNTSMLLCDSVSVLYVCIYIQLCFALAVKRTIHFEF